MYIVCCTSFPLELFYCMLEDGLIYVFLLRIVVSERFNYFLNFFVRYMQIRNVSSPAPRSLDLRGEFMFYFCALSSAWFSTEMVHFSFAQGFQALKIQKNSEKEINNGEGNGWVGHNGWEEYKEIAKSLCMWHIRLQYTRRREALNLLPIKNI